MAKKEQAEIKPGYDETGFTPRNADVLMTYRIEGADDPNAVADWLWYTMRKGTEDQRASIGPVIENGAVIYTINTVYRGASQEEVKRAEILTGIKNTCKESRIRVKMIHEPPPALPLTIPGIDTPEVMEVGGK